VLGDLPKPLADVGGIPLLGHQLRLLQEHGFAEVVLLVSHGTDHIRDWLSGPQRPPIGVRLVDDGTPRGTAGAVLAALPDLAADFAVLYGDTMLNVDLSRFWRWHEADPSAAASLFLHPNDHPQDSDLVEQDVQGIILRFHPYPHPPGVWLPNLVNAALYIVRRDSLAPWRDAPPPLDFGKDLFPQMLERGARLRGYVSPEYIKDAGTPSRLDRVRSAYASGAVARAALSEPQRAVLVDRDGTLNGDVDHLRRAEELEVFPFVGPAMRRLNDAGWRSVVITNQPVLARGEADEDELRRIHARLDSELARDHAYLDRLYYCPHHPDSGFPGEVAALKIACDCRKPAPGLILQAAADLNLDLRASWFIGDSTADLGAAEAAGVSSILVETGCGGLDDRYPFEPGFTRRDFADAVQFILADYPRIAAAGEHLLAEMRPGEDWFLGGLARSGKSTLAAALARELRRRDRAVVVINLDRWVKPEAERGPTVFGRFDMAGLSGTVGRAAQRAVSPVQLDLPAYSRRLKRTLPTCHLLNLPPNAVVLWEGVVALELARLVGGSARTIHVDTDEFERRVRFHHYDARRGIGAAASTIAWRIRDEDEHALLRDMADSVKHRISLDGLLTVQDRPQGDPA
jgi:D,D-heptose 1,7-bisphosphate phosphatase